MSSTTINVSPKYLHVSMGLLIAKKVSVHTFKMELHMTWHHVFYFSSIHTNALCGKNWSLNATSVRTFDKTNTKMRKMEHPSTPDGTAKWFPDMMRKDFAHIFMMCCCTTNLDVKIKPTLQQQRVFLLPSLLYNMCPHCNWANTNLKHKKE